MGLSGKWYNELGSMMDLQVHGADITGTYHTGVGKTKKSGTYVLVGRYDIKSKKSRAVAFVVSWQNKTKSVGSITAWAGQYQMHNGQETITTTWLLTDETKPTNNWRSTLIGFDVFVRTP